MNLLPAPPDSGIILRRVDLPGKPAVKATVKNVIDTKRCTAVGADGWRVGTIEHLLAAAHGLGLDNFLVEIDGEELPAGDGSALSFANLILAAGLVEQDRPRRVLQAVRPIWVAENDCYLILLPPDGARLTIGYTFSADDRAIGAQYYSFTLDRDDFLREIAPARTVAFLDELEFLRRQGLAKSDDMDLAVLVGSEGYINELRMPDEVVRHKILDILGDLYLLGAVHGRIVAVRSGHRLNHRLGFEIARIDSGISSL